MASKKKYVLVTGGVGFLGHAVVKRLLSDTDKTLVVLDIQMPAKPKDDVIYLDCDLCSQNLDSMLSEYTFESVYHFGAQADIETSKRCSKDTLETNIFGTLNLLEWMRKNHVNQLFFASSIYSDSALGSYYAISKDCCEKLIKEHAKNLDLFSYTIFRFGTLYGPAANHFNAIRSMVEQSISGNVVINGCGDEVREYIHVDDAARAVVVAEHRDWKNKTVIVTGPHRLRVREIVELLSEIITSPFTVLFDEQSSAHYRTTPFSCERKAVVKATLGEYHDLGYSLKAIADEALESHCPEERI